MTVSVAVTIANLTPVRFLSGWRPRSLIVLVLVLSVSLVFGTLISLSPRTYLLWPVVVILVRSVLAITVRVLNLRFETLAITLLKSRVVAFSRLRSIICKATFTLVVFLMRPSILALLLLILGCLFPSGKLKCVLRSVYLQSQLFCGSIQSSDSYCPMRNGLLSLIRTL